MKLRFEPDMVHQRAAMTAVLRCLAGQGRIEPAQAWRDPGVIANVLELDDASMLANARAVQRGAGLPQSEVLARIDTEHDGSESSAPNLTVEMETGTGKTYTYLRTGLELARTYGLRKFVVVVPSVAIREGVLKTLQVTRDHFEALYPEVPYRFFAYDAARVGLIDAFARSGNVELMVLTVDAFNKATNVLQRPHDRFGGAPPLQRLRATRPVVILDEPHNFESILRRRSLAQLDPTLVLRYGATHRRRYTLVHRLGPRQAQRRGLVKRIEVVEVDTAGLSEEAAISVRLRATIEAHLVRQARLRPRGIKVLSLVFVDRVDSYVAPDGIVRCAFDRHFEALRHLDPDLPRMSAQAFRAAYFAERRTRGGHVQIDSRTGRSVADEAAYQLIMRDKERLLGLDEPVSFVFSHSALREGWDNPNVFQICTLARSHSAIKKRQEIGRGVRLCVDATGRRVLDPAVNVLQVVAHASYDDYVRALEAELAEELPSGDRPHRPGRAGAASHRTPPTEAADRPPLRVPAQLVAQSAERVLTELGPAPTAAPRGRPCPPLVDLVADALARAVPPRPIRRATVLAIIEALGPTAWLVVDPYRVARTLTETLVTLTAPA